MGNRTETESLTFTMATNMLANLGRVCSRVMARYIIRRAERYFRENLEGVFRRGLELTFQRQVDAPLASGKVMRERVALTITTPTRKSRFRARMTLLVNDTAKADCS